MWHDDGWGMAGWWPVGWLLMLAAVTVVTAVVVLLLRRDAGPGAGPRPVPRIEDAVDWRLVLDGRPARGDIDEDEYRHLRDVLRSG